MMQKLNPDANAEEKKERFLEGMIHECSSRANFTSRKSIVVEGLKASCYVDHEGTR